MKKLRAPTSSLGEAEDSGKVRGLLSVGGASRFTAGAFLPPLQCHRTIAGSDVRHPLRTRGSAWRRQRPTRPELLACPPPPNIHSEGPTTHKMLKAKKVEMAISAYLSSQLHRTFNEAVHQTGTNRTRSSSLKPSLRYLRTSATGSCTRAEVPCQQNSSPYCPLLHPVEEERVVGLDVVGRLVVG